MTLHDRQARFTLLFAGLISEAHRLGLTPVINEVARTIEQQRIYVLQGKSQTMQSAHLERRAGDVLLFRGSAYLTQKADYAPLGAWWKAQEPPRTIWGGDWGWDANHFEYV